jgi:putative transposase
LETIENWRIDYNQVRPHSSLGYLTPEEFATGYENVESKTASHIRTASTTAADWI